MADPNQETRFVEIGGTSSMVYLEAAVIFFGANFVFHQSVFRKVGSRPQFAAFMLVNVFTAYQLAEITNGHQIARYAGMFNNNMELNQRAALNAHLRQKLYAQKF